MNWAGSLHPLLEPVESAVWSYIKLARPAQDPVIALSMAAGSLTALPSANESSQPFTPCIVATSATASSGPTDPITSGVTKLDLISFNTDEVTLIWLQPLR